MKTITAKGIKVKVDIDALNSAKFTRIWGKVNKVIKDNATDEEIAQVNGEKNYYFYEALDMIFDDVDTIIEKLDEKSEGKYATNEELGTFVNEVLTKANLKN